MTAFLARGFAHAERTAVPAAMQNTGLPELLGMGDSYFIDAACYLFLGIVFAATLRRPASCVVWIFSKLDLYADDETNRRVRAVLAFLKS